MQSQSFKNHNFPWGQCCFFFHFKDLNLTPLFIGLHHCLRFYAIFTIKDCLSSALSAVVVYIHFLTFCIELKSRAEICISISVGSGCQLQLIPIPFFFEILDHLKDTFTYQKSNQLSGLFPIVDIL